MADLGELIESFCEDHSDECSFYADYSGRGMFGRHCVGIDCRGNCLRLLILLCDYLYEHGIDSASDAVGSVCQDSLGRNIIIYFPSIEYKDRG